jgi:hypothetical protein
LVGVALLILGISAPIMTGYMLFFDEPSWAENHAAWLVGNPFAWENKGHRVLYATVGGVWAALVAAMSVPWFIERVRIFRREPQVSMGAAIESAPQAVASELATSDE